jgi:LAO/AO transport system kinase
VGQQEVEVAAATDTTLVVVNPGWGDAIQANKAGLLEVADLFVINKADRPGTRETHRDLDAMLDLAAPGDWRPPVVETVASTGDGVDELREAIGAHRAHLAESGLLDRRRHERVEREFVQIVLATVERRITDLRGSREYMDVTDGLATGDLDPYQAADRLLSEMGPIGGPIDGSLGGPADKPVDGIPGQVTGP